MGVTRSSNRATPFPAPSLTSAFASLSGTQREFGVFSELLGTGTKMGSRWKKALNGSEVKFLRTSAATQSDIRSVAEGVWTYSSVFNAYISLAEFSSSGVLLRGQYVRREQNSIWPALNDNAGQAIRIRSGGGRLSRIASGSVNSIAP